MKYLQPYIFLLIGFLAADKACAGNDSLNCIAVADSLAVRNEHRIAALYYSKAAFFSPNQEQKARLQLKASEQLKKTGSFREAASLLGSLSPGNLSDTTLYQVKYQQALFLYLESDFNASANALMQLRYLVSDSSLIYKTYLLDALILNEQFRWHEAARTLRQLNNFLNRSDPGMLAVNDTLINRIYAPQHLPRVKNLKKALKMSTFFPGLGQTYAGYPGEGIFSFGAIVFTGAAMVAGVFYQYYFTSVMLGNVIVAKFYQGGLTRTEFLVNKKNYLRTRGFNSNVRGQLVEAFKN